MVAFNSVLNDARQLSDEDQLRLIDALGSSTADQEVVEAAWIETVKRRAEEIRSGAVKTIPWEVIREESLRRINDNYVG